MNLSANDSRQTIGFRIWNINKSAILLYISKKSGTWTIPSITTTTNHSTVNSLLLMSDQFTGSELLSAVCVVNTVDVIPIQLPTSIVPADISFQYVIYDVIVQYRDIRNIELPDGIRFAQFVSTGHMSTLIYKTSVLTHLIKYMTKHNQL